MRDLAEDIIKLKDYFLIFGYETGICKIIVLQRLSLNTIYLTYMI